MKAYNPSIQITPKLLAVFFIAVVGFVVYSLFAISQIDNTRESLSDQTFTSCTITDKSAHVKSAYLVESSCGRFGVQRELWESLEVQQTYELTISHDNWPEIPHIVKMTPIV